MKLRPFFTYFGGKWRAAPHYPAPVHDTIIEPFAGSAGYSVRYADKQVLLCEKDPTISALWRWLIRVPVAEVLALPLVGPMDSMRDEKFQALRPEARSLIGFWLNKGMTAPCVTPSKWMRDGWRPNSQWGEVIRERIANQLGAIRHWSVLDDYHEGGPNVATWFVDPPYQGRLGKRYREHDMNFALLANWCQARRGQVIVCENAGADWLPFEPFRTIKGTEGRNRSGKSEEVIWTNALAATEEKP